MKRSKLYHRAQYLILRESVMYWQDKLEEAKAKGMTAYYIDTVRDTLRQRVMQREWEYQRSMGA